MRWPLNNFVITQGYSQAHTANDLAAPEGTDILAPETGQIVGINNVAGSYFGGLYIKLKGASGYTYYMGHNSKNLVSLWQSVKEGQVIGKVGHTGQATGPHIHFEMVKNGKAYDPSKIIKGDTTMSKTTLNQARIIAHGVGGRNGFDKRPNALTGASDADLNKHHVGKELAVTLSAFYNSAEGKNWREKSLPKVYADRDAYKKQVVSLTARVKELEQAQNGEYIKVTDLYIKKG